MIILQALNLDFSRNFLIANTFGCYDIINKKVYKNLTKNFVISK